VSKCVSWLCDTLYIYIYTYIYIYRLKIPIVLLILLDSGNIYYCGNFVLFISYLVWLLMPYLREFIYFELGLFLFGLYVCVGVFMCMCVYV
jgi:hypothetical protein